MKKLCTFLLSGLLLTPLVASAHASASFPDVPAGYWAQSSIFSAADAGLFVGDSTGAFHPGDSLTRGSFVTVLSRMFGWTDSAPAAATYADCAPGQWFYASVEAAAAHGVSDGSGLFRPNDRITRSEIAVMLVQALGYDSLAQTAVSASVTNPFSDLTYQAPSAGYILVAYEIGLTNGVEEGGSLLFKPDATATRAEAAAMVMRVYDRYTSDLEWLHGFYAFSSYSQLDLTASLDGVSVGWARLSADADGQGLVVSDTTGGNEWVKPSGAEEVTAYLSAHGTDCNLNVYTDASAVYTKADGTQGKVVDSLLGTPSGQSSAVTALVEAARGYSGLTIDFEALRAPMKSSFTAFLTALRSALPADQSLYVCVQPDDWYDGYDYRAIGAAADKVIVMAHDYDWATPDDYVGTTQTDNPPAGLPDVYRTLVRITDPVTGVQDRSKLALAVSMSSVGLPVDESGRIRSTEQAAPSPATLIARLRQRDTVLGWSEAYATPYATYTVEDGGRWLVWYEDARSVSAKLQLARMLGIQGASLWRLGSIPVYDDPGLNENVWNAVLAQR